MKILAIIQARLGSTRLPNKVLMKLEDRTVLEHVINRVKKSNVATEVVVATTTNENDIDIEKLCFDIGVKVFRGSEDDVLDRFYQVCKVIKPKHIIRITADCPIIDPKVIVKVVEAHLNSDADYTSNTLEETYPDGQDVEIFKFEALEKAWEHAELKSEREHVTPYIRKNISIFKLNSIINETNLKDKRWTLDNKEDYDFLKTLFANIYGLDKLFGMEKVLDLLAKSPEIENINKNITRNAGYIKSLEEDKLV